MSVLWAGVLGKRGLLRWRLYFSGLSPSELLGYFGGGCFAALNWAVGLLEKAVSWKRAKLILCISWGPVFGIQVFLVHLDLMFF
jgi:hypothetical protein